MTHNAIKAMNAHMYKYHKCLTVRATDWDARIWASFGGSMMNCPIEDIRFTRTGHNKYWEN